MNKPRYILYIRRYFANSLSHEMRKYKYTPAASEVAFYRNAFDRADHPSLWQLDKTKYKNTGPITELNQLVNPQAHGHMFGNTCITRYAHYQKVWEPVFPRTPDLSKGELISGANFTRTSGWYVPNEPTILSVGKLSPYNQRPAGYAENAPDPEFDLPAHYPDFRDYRLPKGTNRKAAIYLMGASFLFFFFAFLRGGIIKGIHFLYLTRDVIATGSTEVNVSRLEPGDQITVKWRDRPVFIRKRTPEEIARARKDDALIDTMRDPQLDSERHVNPEWLVNIAVCTHLGCIPGRGGDYGGFFCPCHGSHYDSSGRIRAGPAPANLEVVPYKFLDDNTIKLG